MRYYYIIEEYHNEWKPSYRRICKSLKEAESHVMEYADYYCPKVTCSINKVDEQFYIYEKRLYKLVQSIVFK